MADPISSSFSRSFGLQRSFEPRVQMPVPGKPRALEQRPAQAPGRIPVAEITSPQESEFHNSVVVNLKMVVAARWVMLIWLIKRLSN